MKKIYLCINKIPINGYDHYDPMPKSKDVPAFSGSLSDLDCDPSECDEILAPELLNTIPQDNLHEILTYLASLLRHGGKLVIGGIDVNELTRLFFLGIINEETYNSIVFKNTSKVRGLYSVDTIKKKLKEFNLIIDKVRIDNYSMTIEAIRP